MSYCRFSSDSFRSDVYAYEDFYGGYRIHVAARRHVIPVIPTLPTRMLTGENRVLIRLWVWWNNNLHMRSVRLIPRVRIGLPYDGQSFSVETAVEAANKLVMLRNSGYRVPASAIECLREEATEQQNEEMKRLEV